MDYKMVQLYNTMESFGNITLTNLLKANVSAVPEFFSVILFFIWVFFSGASYFLILKTTGKKRPWHTLTAMSFVCFLLSLFISGMNEASFIFINGYWVGFYILMAVVSLFLLDKYK